MPRLKNHGKYGMMKKYKQYLLFGLSFFLFTHCEKDPMTSYDCNLEHSGLLCRTYLLEGDKSIGYIDHTYKGLEPYKFFYRDNKGKLRQTVTHTYNSQGTLIEKQYIRVTAPDKMYQYAYTNFGELSLITAFEDNKEIKRTVFHYNEKQMLEKEEVFVKGQRDTLVSYEYDSSGELWRQSFFNSSNTLINYKIHTFFDNGITRINSYNSKDIFTGYEIFVNNAYGDIHKHAVYNHLYELTNKKVYDYDNRQLVKLSTFNGLMQLVSQKFFLYS